MVHNRSRGWGTPFHSPAIQCFDVIRDSRGGVPIRVVHDDVLAVALMKVFPLLPGVDVEIEVVEVGQVLGQFRRHARYRWRRFANLAAWPAVLRGSRARALVLNSIELFDSVSNQRDDSFRRVRY